jgi:AraC-like DNA-binding protein
MDSNRGSAPNAAPPMARSPRVDVRSFGCDPTSVVGPAIVEVLEQELLARAASGEIVRLAEGDVLSVAPRGAAVVSTHARASRARVFAPSPDWSVRALDLAGVVPETGPSSFSLLRAGTDSARRASRALRELQKPASEVGVSSDLSRMSLGLELLSVACREHPSCVEPGTRSGGQRLRTSFLEAVRRLEHAELDNLSIATFASEIGCSERHATRLFRDELGQTFGEYVAGLRLERAKDLLRTTDHNIVEVAAVTGWTSLGHFNGMFRRRVGLTPSRFRALARSEAQPDVASIN